MWWSCEDWFGQVLLWEGMVVLWALIWAVALSVGVVSQKDWFSIVSTFEGHFGLEWFWTASTFRSCCGLERTYFQQFQLGRIWWSWKDWFFTISTLKAGSGPGKNWFLQFSPWEGLAVLKGLIFSNFLFAKAWNIERTGFGYLPLWAGCGGLEGDFVQFLLWEGVVVLKGLVFNNFHRGRLW